MATVAKTWAWPTDIDGWTDAGLSNVTFGWIDGDGNPADCVEFQLGQKNVTASEEGRSATGETWESWGVPAGSTVTDVQVTAWDRRCFSDVKLSAADVAMRVTSGGSSVHSAGDLVSTSLGVVAGAWGAGAAGTQRAVDASFQASNTSVQFVLAYQVTTSGGGGAADTSYRFDNITLTITYTPPSNDARAEVSWAELETPELDARADVSWAELETPVPDARAEVSWAELEAPTPDARAEVSWAELETPVLDARAEVSWAEFEAPIPDARADVSWAELETPFPDSRAEVSWTELQVPDVGVPDAAAEVSWAELETPLPPARAEVSWAELEVATLDARAEVSWAELEVGLAPARADVSWSAFEVETTTANNLVAEGTLTLRARPAGDDIPLTSSDWVQDPDTFNLLTGRCRIVKTNADTCIVDHAVEIYVDGVLKLTTEFNTHNERENTFDEEKELDLGVIRGADVAQPHEVTARIRAGALFHDLGPSVEVTVTIWSAQISLA